MNNKYFYFKNDSYWTDNGCDCCEADYFECYNSEQTHWMFGSAESEEGCYAMAILTYLGVDDMSNVWEHIIWQMHIGELESYAKALGIVVEIEGVNIE